MADKTELKVSLIGLEETLKALKQYDPDARKELFNGIASAARLIRDDARRSISSVDLPSGWRKQTHAPRGDGAWKNRVLTRNGRGWPVFNESEVKRGIRSYMSRRRASRGSVVTTRGIVMNKSYGGIIDEFATKSHTSVEYPWVNSKPFIQALGRFSGGRMIWAAGERNRDKVRSQILDAVSVANQRLQSHLDSASRSGRP